MKHGRKREEVHDKARQIVAARKKIRRAQKRHAPLSYFFKRPKTLELAAINYDRIS